MQENQNENTAAPAKTSAEHMLAMLRQAEAAVFIETNSKGELVIQYVTSRGEFRPEHDPVHAYVQAMKDSHPDLLAMVNGKPTDALRFAALRDFAALANTDEERFEVVNGMLLKYETEGDLPAEKDRTVADYVKMADFLCFALAETEPVLTAPTAKPEIDAPKIALPHGVARPTYQ